MTTEDETTTATTITYRAPDGAETVREVPRRFDGHDVEWTVSRDQVDGQLVCRAGVGGWCRLACAAECGAEQWPCGSYYPAEDGGDGEWEQHPMEDCGHCHVQLFIEQTTLQESYAGNPQLAVAGPVEVEWDGDTYVWLYPADAPAPSTGLGGRG